MNVWFFERLFQFIESKHAGTFNYICGLDDALGMKGKVIVLP